MDDEVDIATLLVIPIQDARTVVEILHPIYGISDAEDANMSIEVSPHLAYDAQGIHDAVRHLWKEVNRFNLFLASLALRRASCYPALTY